MVRRAATSGSTIARSCAQSTVADGGIPDALAAAVRQRRPDADPGALVAADWPHLHRMLDDYIAAGLTKFVIRPVGPRPVAEFVDRFVSELAPRQN